MHKKSLLLIGLVAGLLTACNSGSSNNDSNNQQYNPQPSNANAINYFSSYAKLSNQMNNTIFQVVFDGNLPTELNLFNLATYNSNFESNNAISSYLVLPTQLTGSETYQVVNHNNITNVVGYIQLSRDKNNLVYTGSFKDNEENAKGLYNETSTIGMAVKNQVQLNQGSYIGSCFNLPNVFGKSSSTKDTCNYQIEANGSFSITDLNTNTNFCSTGSYYQSSTNPYFYIFKCGSIQLQGTFSLVGNTKVFNPLIETSQKVNSVVSTSIVASMIQIESLNNVENNTSKSLNQTNLTSANSFGVYNTIISIPNGLSGQILYTGINSPSSYCSIFCALENSLTPEVLNVFKMVSTTYSNSDVKLIGNNEIESGFFVDNNGYSYYMY